MYDTLRRKLALRPDIPAGVHSRIGGDAIVSDEQRAMKEGVVGVFGRAAPTYDSVGPRFFAHFGRRLVEIVDLPVGARVLDVAAGRGAVLFPMAERIGPAGHVNGIDLAEPMVAATAAEISRRGMHNATIRQMDAEALEFPDATFDAVTCGFALFLFPDLARTLSEFRRVLRRDGRLVVSTWGPEDERWQWNRELIKAHHPTPPPGLAPPDGDQQQGPDFQTSTGMRAIMEGAGFSRVEVKEEETEFVYADEETWWQTQWSHGFRYALETMPADALAAFKAAAFERLQPLKQPEGFHQRFSALFTVATQP